MNSVQKAPIARRGLMGAALAAVSAGLASASDRAQPTPARTPEALAAERLRQRRAPNVMLLDHTGRRLRLYDDVMKGRTVLLNVMYSVCSNVCPPATRNLIEARRLLGDDAKALHFVSMTLTPLSDTPEALRAYKRLHGIGADWTFLTGTPANVERAQRALGFIGADEGDAASDVPPGHTAMARLCDERVLRWSHVNTMQSPRSIARMIRFELA